MASAKIAVSISRELLTRVDRLVKEKHFSNRSQAVQQALREQLAKLDRGRLARECAKLDPKQEKQLAEEGLNEDAAQWPAY